MVVTKYPNPKITGAFERRGRVLLSWPLTRSHGKIRLQSLGLSFALTHLRVVTFFPRLTCASCWKARLAPAPARPPRQVAPQDQAVIIGPGWTSRRER